MTGLYDGGKEGFLDGSINWVADEIQAVLLDLTEYTADLDSDRNLSDIPVAARIAISESLSNKTGYNGAADADEGVFIEVAGPVGEGLALFKVAGNDANSRLIAYIDGFTLTPNGGNIQAVWDDGPDKIFRL